MFWETGPIITAWILRFFTWIVQAATGLFWKISSHKASQAKDTKLITFLKDYSHVTKRVRNNIWSSSVNGEKHTRELTISGNNITWDMWLAAYRSPNQDPPKVAGRFSVPVPHIEHEEWSGRRSPNQWRHTEFWCWNTRKRWAKRVAISMVLFNSWKLVIFFGICDLFSPLKTNVLSMDIPLADRCNPTLHRQQWCNWTSDSMKCNWTPMRV